MHISQNLLKEYSEGWASPPSLQSYGQIKGCYNPLQFVLKLHPDIIKELDSIEIGIKSVHELRFSTVQAFSTYFHETIHWWQHIGSIYGMMLSLIYPTQAHVNHSYLKELLRDIGPVKPLVKIPSVNAYYERRRIANNINRILNYWHDLTFFSLLSMKPKNASKLTPSPYFNNLGHTYYIAWSCILWLLSATFDPDLKILPDVRNWEKEFRILREKKIEGFYFGSKLILSQIGAKEIFEGQARFSQLQYLYYASDRKMNWNEFNSIGMLNGVYKDAFDSFLKILDESWPESPGHPLVSLFLLICDIAINPTDGFPFNIIDFQSFVVSNDPGIRFYSLCFFIKLKHPYLKNSIKKHSREEYIQICEILCKDLVCPSPCAASERVDLWAKNHVEIIQLLEEDKALKFNPDNLPVRVFFAKFVRFQVDKLINPEYFCWPGFWSVDDHDEISDLIKFTELFKKHAAIFVGGSDGNVYPNISNCSNEQSAMDTFNSFYTWNIIYDLTRQWIIQEGKFDFNFSWLTDKYSKTEIIDWACNHFQNIYQISPFSFNII